MTHIQEGHSMSVTSFHLAFFQNQLFKTFFLTENGRKSLFSVRGKTTGAYVASGSFQWTKATQALCALFLKYKLGQTDRGGASPYIQGHKDSLASSLQYALSKKPIWLREMFGSTKSGMLRSDLLFLTSNPSRANGPVVVAINSKLLGTEHITVSHNEDGIVGESEIEKLYLSILRHYEPVSDISPGLGQMPSSPPNSHTALEIAKEGEEAARTLM